MKVRIVCKTPPPLASKSGLPALQWIPSWYDVSIVAVDDDGAEQVLDGVSLVRWECKAGESSQAVLHVEGAEIDVVADGRFAPTREALETALRNIVANAKDEEREDMRDSVDEQFIEEARALLEGAPVRWVRLGVKS